MLERHKPVVMALAELFGLERLEGVEAQFVEQVRAILDSYDQELLTLPAAPVPQPLSQMDRLKLAMNAGPQAQQMHDAAGVAANGVQVNAERERRQRELEERFANGDKIQPAPKPGFNHAGREALAFQEMNERLMQDKGAKLDSL